MLMLGILMPWFAGAVIGAVIGAGAVWYILVRKLHQTTTLQLNRQSEFINAAAHQLRAPLNQVLGMVQSLSLRATQFDPENQKLIETLTRSGGNMKAALLDVLDLLELKSGELRFEKDVEYLPDTIEFVQRPLASSAERSKTKLSFEISPRARVWAVYDEVRLRQCVSAMLKQSLEQASGGAVHLFADIKRHKDKKAKADIIVTVSDDSGAMDQKSADAYFSLKNYKRNRFMKDAEGSALSLILARLLVRKMGGDMRAKSAHSNGVQFYCRVPVSIANAAPKKESDGKVSLLEAASRALSDVTVLIVEDNDVNVQILQVFLKKTNPKRILVAGNGEEALALLAREKCGLILMDVHMPVMDGITATKRIRQSGKSWSNVPILAVTAAARGSEREACDRAGVTGFIAKPVSPNEIYENVAAVMPYRNVR